MIAVKMDYVLAAHTMPEYSHKSLLCPDVDFAVNAYHHSAVAVASFLAKSAEGLGKRLFSQVNIEVEEQSQGYNVLLCNYPGGDWYCWFIDGVHFVLIALVNEKMKVLGIMSVTQGEEFRKLLSQVSNDMNIGNHYPVENPEEFTPRVHTQENPPDASN